MHIQWLGLFFSSFVVWISQIKNKLIHGSDSVWLFPYFILRPKKNSMFMFKIY